ncbi:MAG: flagellar biosynthesis protein FlhB [Dokdonella sp.]
MAEHDDKESRTEQASDKRLREAREKGDVPRSRDFSAAIVTLSGVAILLFLHQGFGTRLAGLLSGGLKLRREEIFDVATLTESLRSLAVEAGWTLLPIFAVTFAATLCAPLAAGGWNFSAQGLGFKGSRLDPIAGIGRLFSAKVAVELGKALLKVAALGTAAGIVLAHRMPDLIGLGNAPIGRSTAVAFDLAGLAALALAGAFALIGLIDLPWQLFDYARRQRMTREELKQEYKESEGSPEVKGKIRQMQQQMARQRMMADVPTADVVITNPTHFAVALRYDDGRMAAPTVVAKGVDHIAAQIRELAATSRVPMLAAPPLARALYRTTDIGAEIPSALYVAVAQVLTYVFQLQRAIEAGSPYPQEPSPEVDPALSDPPSSPETRP